MVSSSPDSKSNCFAPWGKLDEVSHPAGLAAKLNDVAAPDSGRGDLDAGNQRAAGSPGTHRVTSVGMDGSADEWHGQAHASQITGRSAGTEAGEKSVQEECVPILQAVER